MVKTKTRITTKLAIATLAVGALAAAAVALKKPTVPCVCSDGYKNCSGTCASLQTDANNCGTCGKKCSSGDVCKQGKCLHVTCTDSDGGKDFTKKGVVTITSLEELKASLDDNSQLDEVNQALAAAGANQGTGSNRTLTDKCTTEISNQDINWSADKPTLTEFICNGIKPKVIYHDCSKEGKTCENGACVLKCSTNQTTCDDKCTNIKSDKNNCGACGTKCESGSTCTSGTCKSKCLSNQTYCDNTCVNLQTSKNNCGACGKTCSATETCTSGSCVTKPIPCAKDGWEVCNNKCVSLNTSINCGSCGNKCASGTVCKNKTCVTSTPLSPL